MPDDDEYKGWASVIRSVKTPLGFFALCALVLAAGLTGGALVGNKVPAYAPIVVLGLVVLCVFVVMLKNPEAFYPPSEWRRNRRVIVKLVFDAEPPEIDFELERCVLVVRDLQGREKWRQCPNLTLGHGGWTFHLPDVVVDTDSLRLELAESNGGAWRASSFPPYQAIVEVHKVN